MLQSAHLDISFVVDKLGKGSLFYLVFVLFCWRSVE